MRLFRKQRIPCASALFVSSFLIFTSFLVLLALYIVLLPPSFQLVCLLASFLCLWFFSHDLAHFMVGSALGMRFPFFFSGKSNLRHAFRNVPLLSLLTRNIPALGVKIDYTNFFCVSRRRRAFMFASGALASMLSPLFVLATAWQLETEGWVRMLVSFLVLGNIVFTLPFSYLYGDFLKARRQG